MLFIQQRFGRFQRLIVPLLLIAGAQFGIQLGFFAAQFLDRGLGFFFKTDLASIDVIETAGNLAGEFDMRHLILAYRHLCRPVDEDVRALQQRISQEAVGTEVFSGKFLLLVFVGRHTFQPAQRRDHGE